MRAVNLSKVSLLFFLFIFSSTLALAGGLESKSAENSSNTPALGKNVPITGNVDQLKHFFQALNGSKTKKIRIAHFGDSLIEGDVITSDLRENLQKRFGGNGAGFVSINSDDVQMRKTTKLTYSTDWEEASIFKRNPKNWPFGINACVFVPSSKSWVKYETSSFSKSLKSFSTARLIYKGGTPNCKIKYSFNGAPAQTASLSSGNDVKVLDLDASGTAGSVKIDFDNCGGASAFFYGVSLENGNGIYVDNFPIKGNSGVSLVDIPKDVLKGFNDQLNYKLIIINFGINVLSPTYSDYNWYAKRMEKVINYFKEAFPQTSILLVSVGDKAIKKGSRFITDPQTPMLLEAQKDVAKKTGIAFWNLFEAMGGENSIPQWVSAGPPLAFRDYCHLTPEGGTRVADLLTSALMDEYNKAK
ncbi:MAG: hypothetical protein R6W90_07200 [Ignavibacteriaceae bacterium]